MTFQIQFQRLEKTLDAIKVFHLSEDNSRIILSKKDYCSIIDNESGKDTFTKESFILQFKRNLSVFQRKKMTTFWNVIWPYLYFVNWSHHLQLFYILFYITEGINGQIFSSFFFLVGRVIYFNLILFLINIIFSGLMCLSRWCHCLFLNCEFNVYQHFFKSLTENVILHKNQICVFFLIWDSVFNPILLHY